MNDSVQVLLEELARTLGSMRGFVCVYGSQASRSATPESDVDVMVGVETPDSRLFSRALRLVTEHHRRNALSLDAEVPFENKLVVQYRDFACAASLCQFFQPCGLWDVSPIVKSEAFLGSETMRLRLVFNVLTGPCVAIGPDLTTYHQMRAVATDSLRALFISLAGVRARVDPLLAATTLGVGEGPARGENYLGYKRNAATRAVLEEVFTPLVRMTTSERSHLVARVQRRASECKRHGSVVGNSLVGDPESTGDH